MLLIVAARAQNYGPASARGGKGALNAAYLFGAVPVKPA
jgi:hypothetical protein